MKRPKWRTHLEPRTILRASSALLFIAVGCSDASDAGGANGEESTGATTGGGGTTPGTVTSGGTGTTGGAPNDSGPSGHDGTGGASPSADGGGSAGTMGGATIDSGRPPPTDAGHPDADTKGLDPEITGIVGAISSTRILSAVDRLAGFTTRNTCSNNGATGNAIGAARDWIRGQMQAIGGLTVSLHSFSALACANFTASVTDQNVVAVKLGAHPDRVIVIGGHYDSRTIDPFDPVNPAPGANDSGSQTAVVLEAARVMAALKFDASLVFAAFAGEEQGLFGSAQFVKDYRQYVTPTARIEAMLDLDIVGGDRSANDADALSHFRLFSPGTPREIMIPMGVTDDESPSRGIMRYIGYWGSQYVSTISMTPVLREDRPGRGSDHQSFLNQGYPGVHFIETVESPNTGMPGSHQHTADDLPTNITPSYVTRIAQVVVAVGAGLARAPMPPQLARVTGSGAGPWTLTWGAPVSGPVVDHYAIAARPTTENFYRTRRAVPANQTMQSVGAADVGLAGAAAFYISIAAVDAAGHESLFAYPEYRCTATGCSVPADALNVTAMQ